VIEEIINDNTNLKAVLAEKEAEISRLNKDAEYKQAVWAQFEQELSQVIKKDSALYKQIQGTTLSLRAG
jgi:hypothetical protein